MSERHLKRKSGTDWARIDRMTDDEIDTSDIPPLGDDFFKSAKWLLPRWMIDLGDFKQAREFAAHILKRKWQQNLDEPPVRKLEHRAFNTSLIVSYARPFHYNRTFKGAPKSSLRKHVLEVLNAAEIRLHKRVLELRDTVVAHSDGVALKVLNMGSGTLMSPVKNLSESEVRLLKGMTKKWIDYLGIERSDLRRRLAEAVQGSGDKTVSTENRARSRKKQRIA